MDFITRPAVLSDAQSIASIQISTQRHAYQSVLPGIVQLPINLDVAEANKREKLEQDAINQSCTFVAEDKENNIIGYASGGRNRDETLIIDSELYNLFVLPAYQNLGVGTALFRKVVEFLIDCNLQSLTLWTIPIPSTVRYYTILGGVFHSNRAVQILDTDIELHCYVWDNLISLQEILSKKIFGV